MQAQSACHDRLLPANRVAAGGQTGLASLLSALLPHLPSTARAMSWVRVSRPTRAGKRPRVSSARDAGQHVSCVCMRSRERIHTNVAVSFPHPHVSSALLSVAAPCFTHLLFAARVLAYGRFRNLPTVTTAAGSRPMSQTKLRKRGLEEEARPLLRQKRPTFMTKETPFYDKSDPFL